jgi:hypothetical protein
MFPLRDDIPSQRYPIVTVMIVNHFQRRRMGTVAARGRSPIHEQTRQSRLSLDKCLREMEPEFRNKHERFR